VLSNDDKSSGSTLTITDTSTPANGTVTVNPDKTITYHPNANFSGADSFTYTIDDDDALTNDGPSTTTVSITVNALNDAPTFTGGGDQTVNEDPGAQTVSNWATNISAGAANESGQTLTFVVTGNTNTALFSAGPAISPSGTLTYGNAEPPTSNYWDPAAGFGLVVWGFRVHIQEPAEVVLPTGRLARSPSGFGQGQIRSAAAARIGPLLLLLLLFLFLSVLLFVSRTVIDTVWHTLTDTVWHTVSDTVPRTVCGRVAGRWRAFDTLREQ